MYSGYDRLYIMTPVAPAATPANLHLAAGLSLRTLKGSLVPSMLAFRKMTKGLAALIRSPPRPKLIVSSTASAAAFLPCEVAAISSGVMVSQLGRVLSNCLLKRAV